MQELLKKYNTAIPITDDQQYIGAVSASVAIDDMQILDALMDAMTEYEDARWSQTENAIKELRRVKEHFD